MRTSLLLNSAALAVIAACSSDAVLPGPGSGASQAATLRAPIRLVVVDSTQLPFAGTAAERAAGVYAFQIVGTAPVVASGDYVAGRQGGLFLGRVVSVSLSPGRLTLQLAPAAWSEVYPDFHVRIPLTQGAGSAPSPYGRVSWGPWEAASQPGTAHPSGGAPSRTPPRVSILAPSDVLDSALAFLLSNLDLCAASGVASGCANISAKVLSGMFSLTGGVDVGAGFDLTTGFNAHATVDQKVSAALDFQLTGNGSVQIDVPIPDFGFVRKFKIGPDSGQIKLGLVVGVEGDIGNTTVEPHFEAADTSRTGLTLTVVDGVKFQWDAHPHFDAGAKVISLGDLGAKLSFGPTFTVEFSFPGGGGLTFDIGGDIFDHATMNLTGLLGSENWHMHVSSGVEATVDANAKVPLFGIDVGPSETFTPLEFNVLDLWGTGDLYVTSST
ncbi:MAG TPA: hypothetical protein VM736_12155, partial [Gemmatimonadales bacterium]|nr:hypothetical protein [Gemmatimonadales bacterium]